MNDYIEQALRTKSDGFHTDLCHPALLARVIAARVNTGDLVDAAKKAIFYGKASPRITAMDNRMVQALDVGHIDPDLIHGILGVDSEAAELMEILHDAMVMGTPINPDRIIDEAGDLLWYLALVFHFTGTSFEEVMEKNISKLRVRFPHRFEAVRAITPDKTAEQAAQVF